MLFLCRCALAFTMLSTRCARCTIKVCPSGRLLTRLIRFCLSAAWNGMTVSASLLVDAQADVNVADSYGRTPLLLSARMGLTPMAGFFPVSLYHRAQRNPTENQIDTLNGFDLFCCDVASRFRGMIRPLTSKPALLNFSIKFPETNKE